CELDHAQCGTDRGDVQQEQGDRSHDAIPHRRVTILCPTNTPRHAPSLYTASADRTGRHPGTSAIIDISIDLEPRPLRGAEGQQQWNSTSPLRSPRASGTSMRWTTRRA